MKKFIVICLALMMLCTNAFAATWLDGLGPNKPYTGVPEVNLDETIGYMMLSPINDSNVRAGSLTLGVYMPREDVAVGEGFLYLHTEEDGPVLEIEITEQTMTARAMTEEELEARLWGCGTVFEIELGEPLMPNRHYVVQMTEGCIISTSNDVLSPAIAGREGWYFNTIQLSYVENLTYFTAIEGENTPVEAENVQAGDTASFSIVIGENAVAAAMYAVSGTFYYQQSYFTESCETTVTFPEAGEVVWGVVYMDAEGNTVDYTEIITNVSAKAE